MSGELDAGYRSEGGAPFPYILSTPVWGPGHLGLFLNVCLPSLLAPGNLPGLTFGSQSKYLIYTPAEDEQQLREAPTFRRLCEIVTVEVITITEEITQPHRTMSDCHIDSLRRADDAGAAAIFLPPDCVWSDGSMMALERIARSGKSIIHMSGMRLARDEVVPEFAGHYTNDKMVLALKPRELVKMGMNHLHPIALTHFWNEFEGGLMPANLVWTVPGEGLLLRCFHLHPLMVKSQVPFAKFASTIDDDLPLHACPDSSRDYVVTDSDELLAFEMSGISRVVGTVCAKGSIDGVAAWAEVGTNKRHRELINNTIRLKMTDGDGVGWRSIEADSDKVVQAVARINDMPLAKLFLQHPSVYSGRMIAFALGRGNSADYSAAFIIRALVTPLAFLIKLNAEIYRLIFFTFGDFNITHPYWLIRKNLLKVLGTAVSPGDRRVVLIGEDFRFAARLQAAYPEISIQSFAQGTAPSSMLLQLNGSNEVDLLATLDADPLRPQSQTFARIAKRQILVRMTGDCRPVDGPYDQIIYFGGGETRVCDALWNAVRRLRSLDSTQSLVARLAVKVVGLCVNWFIYIGIALAAFVVNSLGLFVETLRRQRPKAASRGIRPLS